MLEILYAEKITDFTRILIGIFFNFTSTTKHYDISKLRAYSWVQQTTLHGRISVWASSVWVPLKRTFSFTLTNLNSRNFLSTIPNYWVTSKQWPMQMKYPTIHLIYMAKILGNYIKNKTNCTLGINLFFGKSSYYTYTEIDAILIHFLLPSDSDVSFSFCWITYMLPWQLCYLHVGWLYSPELQS